MGTRTVRHVYAEESDPRVEGLERTAADASVHGERDELSRRVRLHGLAGLAGARRGSRSLPIALLAAAVAFVAVLGLHALGGHRGTSAGNPAPYVSTTAPRPLPGNASQGRAAGRDGRPRRRHERTPSSSRPAASPGAPARTVRTPRVPEPSPGPAGPVAGGHADAQSELGFER